MKTSDTVAVQMRLERVTESAGQFANTKCGSICDNKWNAIRPGYCVNDVGMVLQRGATRVPYVGDDGDLKYVISQLSFVCAFNDDPRIRYARALPNCFPLAKLDHQPRGRRLGGVGHVTAADLGGIKHLRTVTQNTQLMEAFEMLSEGAHTPLALWAAPLMTLACVPVSPPISGQLFCLPWRALRPAPRAASSAEGTVSARGLGLSPGFEP